jgi:hypothetical protein
MARAPIHLADQAAELAATGLSALPASSEQYWISRAREICIRASLRGAEEVIVRRGTFRSRQLLTVPWMI